MATVGEAHKHAGLVDGSPESSSQPSDADLSGFVDRFRSLVGQVSREVEDGLEIARRDGTSRDHPPSSYPEIDTAQALSAEELDSLLHSDEFGMAQAPEDHVIILGGYVRRMSTIESLGSREMGSASSVHRNTTFMSNHSSSGHTQQSRPPTRMNTVTTDVVAEPSSHNSSLNGCSTTTSASPSYHSASSGSRVFHENPDLLESPMEIGARTQD